MSTQPSTAEAVRYEPRGGCKRLHECRDDEVLIAGPAGTGKTHAALMKGHLINLDNPGARGLICRKTLVSLGSSSLDTWRRHVATAALADGTVTYYGGSSEEPPQYRYDNGSIAVIGGLDNPTKIMSTQYDWIYVGEAIELTVDDWEALTARLRNGRLSFQQLMADTNPAMPTHWLKQRCDSGATTLIESRHEDNPLYVNLDGTYTEAGQSYLARLDRLTGVRHSRLRLGLWVAAEGTVWEGFDPALHVIDRFEIPDDWPRRWVVDFGYRNPFVCQWWAEDHDGRQYRYRELYMTGRIVEDHARQILAAVTDERGEWVEPEPQAIICDHDAEDRATLERHLGLGTSPADKRVTVGLEAVAARLRPDDTGRPALFFLRDSLIERDPELVDALKPTCTEEEIPGYVWDTSGTKAPKEVPLKVNDHGCDTTRYLVADRDLGGQPGVRWLTD